MAYKNMAKQKKHVKEIHSKVKGRIKRNKNTKKKEISLEELKRRLGF